MHNSIVVKDVVVYLYNVKYGYIVLISTKKIKIFKKNKNGFKASGLFIMGNFECWRLNLGYFCMLNVELEVGECLIFM